MYWIIYYGDGSIHTSDEAGQIPARDVQVIAQADPYTGWYMVTGADYYIRRGTQWAGVDIFGLYDYLLDSGLVLFGRAIDADEYEAICRRATEEMRTHKSAWLPRERRP